MRSRRSAFIRRLLCFLAAFAIASTILTACDGNDDTAPVSLMNGSRATELPSELEGVENPTVLTAVTVSRDVDMDVGSTVTTCLRRAEDDRPVELIVVRVGVDGESVTFASRSHRGLYGCDNSEGTREGDRPWCGSAFGELSEGRLDDPRLDLGPCSTDEGAALGFAWVEPDPGARYVVVAQPGYAEVYETAAGLPVRVTTRDVEIEKARAGFDVSEHGPGGGLIRQYRLDARVAG